MHARGGASQYISVGLGFSFFDTIRMMKAFPNVATSSVWVFDGIVQYHYNSDMYTMQGPSYLGKISPSTNMN